MYTGRTLVAGNLALIYPDSTPEEADLVRFCVVHRWASGPVPDWPGEVPAQCPWCRLDADELRGRQRFDALTQQLLEQQLALPEEARFMATALRPLQISMMPCTSKTIGAYGYDAETQTLAVQFSNGHVYHYQAVPIELYVELCDAESKGAFFGSRIRKQCQKWTRITGTCGQCGDVGFVGETCCDCGTSTYTTEVSRTGRKG